MISTLVIDCIEREYNVKIEKAEELSRLYLYRSYKLQMKNGAKYILKELPRNTNREVLYAIVRLENIFEQARIEIGKIKRTRSGTLWIDNGIGTYVLFEYVEGCIAQPCHAYEVGRSLRELHMGMSSTSGVNITTAQIIAEGLKSSEEKEKTEFLDDDTWKKVRNLIAKKNSDKTQLIHGDFHKGNVLYTEDGRIGVIDLDDIRMGCYEEDIATWVFSMMYHDGCIEYSNVNYIALFLEGYYSTSHVSMELWNELQNALHYYCAVHLAKHCANFKFIRRHKSTKRFLDALVVLINDDEIGQKMISNIEGERMR